MLHLRGLVFNLCFAVASVLVAGGTALVAPFSRRGLFFGSWLWAACWFWLARLICGIRLEQRGARPAGEVIVAIKHQSFYDALLTLYLWPQPDAPVVIMKDALGRIPVWGFVARRHGVIFVDRNRRGGALKEMLRQVRDPRRRDRPVIIFPEGTRVPVGETPPLKAGLSGLYATLKRPVAPVAVQSGRCWPKGLAKHSGVVTVAFLPDVPAGLDRDHMEAAVHAAINADPLTCEVRA